MTTNDYTDEHRQRDKIIKLTVIAVFVLLVAVSAIVGSCGGGNEEPPPPKLSFEECEIPLHLYNIHGRSGVKKKYLEGCWWSPHYRGD